MEASGATSWLNRRKLEQANQMMLPARFPERLVSAAGFEPATHALKGHCSTN